MPRLLQRLLVVPRMSLGSWPTPVDRYEMAGQRLHIKRDDCSGFGRGGAKTRKLECLFGALEQQQVTDVIVVVGNITNLAFDLLALQSSVRAHVFVIDDPPAAAADREAFFTGVRSEVTLLSTSRLQALQTAWSCYRRLKKQGRRPFMLIPGASHPSGVVGNALGLIEYVEQCIARQERPCARLYVSLATATSAAGFVLAAAALRDAGKPAPHIIGVEVYSRFGRHRVWPLLRWTAHWLQVSLPKTAELFSRDLSQLRGGFGQVGQSTVATCTKVRQQYGIDIDPVFGGKTFAAMQQRHDPDALFWHCGFTPEWRQVAATSP